MPILSTLRTAAVAGVRNALNASKQCHPVTVPTRRMGGHAMEITPSNYQKYRVKDNIVEREMQTTLVTLIMYSMVLIEIKYLYIYFTALGVIPLALITTYANVRIGPAQLVETPDDYVPAPHEYFKSPISRFFAKYCIDPPEKVHERTLYYLYKSDQKRKSKIQEKKVKNLTKMKNDTKGWYFVPITGTIEERIETKDRYYLNPKK